MKVSICLLTLDRYELTKQVLEQAIRNAGTLFEELEFLVCDNGSTDRRIVEYIQNASVYYHRVNSKNEGCAKGFNQLLARATGDYFCLIGNDILLPPGWLAKMIEYADAVENSGIIGIKCTAAVPEPTLEHHKGHPVKAHYLNKTIDKVFGTMLFRRGVLDRVGGFYEGFDVYGIEDSDFNNRVNLAGFKSLYVPDLVSTHLGDDVGHDSAYRKMKDESLNRNAQLLAARIANYFNGFYEPIPNLREPI